MLLRLATALTLPLLIAGCATIDGTYVPSCDAFAGPEIRLADNRFIWRKFTDQVEVDESGNKVDPHPGFPREGGYEANGTSVTLTSDDGIAETFSIVQAGRAFYLLTAAENAEFESSGAIPRCALVRQPAGT